MAQYHCMVSVEFRVGQYYDIIVYRDIEVSQ